MAIPAALDSDLNWRLAQSALGGMEPRRFPALHGIGADVRRDRHRGIDFA